MGNRYTKHKREASSGIEQWVSYMDFGNDLGSKLLELENDYETQLDLVKQHSNEAFIRQIIDLYGTDSSWRPLLERFIDTLIDVSGAKLKKDEELTAREYKRTVRVKDGKSVKKPFKQKSGRRYEQWTPQQEKFVKIRLKKGKTPKEIYEEYNYSNSIKFARSKSGIYSKIRRLR